MGITLLQYYADKASEINARAFEGIATRKDWEKQEPGLRRHFLHSLGLDGLPEDADPRVKDYGTESGKGWRARKVGYRIINDCYGSALIFYPDPLPEKKNPGVLYLCGHSNFGILEYHPHAIMWAKRGYVCVIIDTIRQTDNTGDHSGLSSFGRADWVSMGYTASGGEFLNSWGGMNVLCSLPEVDTARVGATGLSGGGAHCFFLGVADLRVKAVASTCGVLDLKHTIKNRSFNTNCDCMFVYNVYQKDIAEYGGLIAPRPLLLAHANGDYLFTPEENRELHAGIKKVYDLYGAGDKCSLFMFDGPHSYQPPSVKAINDWFDKHVAGKPMKEGTLGAAELSEKQCSIFNGDFPIPDRLDILPEILTPPRSFPIPDTLEGVTALRARVLPVLKERVFNYVFNSPDSLSMEVVHEWKMSPTTPFPVMKKYRGTMGGMELWVTHQKPADNLKDVLVYVCDRDEEEYGALARLPVNAGRMEVITVEPRGSGLNGSSRTWDVSVGKAGLYLGLTHVLLWIKDLRDVLAYLGAHGGLTGKNVYLYGARDAGIAALYTTLFDESIKGVIIKDIYRSHKDGGHIPGILKVLDIEQTLGLLAPRVIGLDTHQWEFVFWSARLYQRLGIWDHFVHTHSMEHTLARIFKPQ